MFSNKNTFRKQDENPKKFQKNPETQSYDDNSIVKILIGWFWFTYSTTILFELWKNHSGFYKLIDF